MLPTRILLDILLDICGALLVGSDQFLGIFREQLVTLAARQSLPTMFAWREIVEIGGLMSYSISFAEAYREASVYAGRIVNSGGNIVQRLIFGKRVRESAGIAPKAEAAQAANPGEVANAAELTTSDVPTWNVCAGTARKIKEIAARNIIRAEAGLPLLPFHKNCAG